jgi:hypothetical protein
MDEELYEKVRSVFELCEVFEMLCETCRKTVEKTESGISSNRWCAREIWSLAEVMSEFSRENILV